MLPNAGYVKWFDVIAYDEGFMLLLPDKLDPTNVKPFEMCIRDSSRRMRMRCSIPC